MSSLALTIERPSKQIERIPRIPNFPLAPSITPARHPASAPLSRYNRLLRALPADVLARIAPHLQLVELPQGAVLYEAGALIKDVYFPINSIVSLLYTMENGDCSQTAMVGCEGMVGLSPFMGSEIASSCAVMQTSGSLFKLRASLLAREFDRSRQAIQLLLRYTQTLFIQLAQSAVCNRHHSLVRQLSRWLLTTLDRLHGNELVVTHELIAKMLGARREGITEVVGHLQRMGMISCRRGHITVIDRPALEQHACECYAVVKRQTEHVDLVPEPVN